MKYRCPSCGKEIEAESQAEAICVHLIYDQTAKEYLEPHNHLCKPVKEEA